MKIADRTDVKSDGQARVLGGRVMVVFVTARATDHYNALELSAHEVYPANERSSWVAFSTALYHL
jgi:hypothetical protein